MNLRRIITTAAVIAGLAATAATPTLAAGRGQTPDSIARQYESLALPSDTYTVGVEHGARAGRTIDAWGQTFAVE